VAEVLCPVMVGRQAELGALDDALAVALAGAGRMVFVTGEPGIGKSRLARELTGRARAAGAAVISGRAVPGGSSTPYRPLTEALLQALRDLQLAGRAADAARAAELAEAAERELAGFPVWADLARMFAAEAALADGWGEPWRWLETARQTFAAHGIDRLAWRCEARLGGAVPPAWASLGVTAREADVLRLVGEGLANKEIASRLYLSPRTVEKHVESLLRKTGARSRTQLMALLAAGAGPAGEWPSGEPSRAAT
jgi:DNA-binding CsgD family transcriptional regulator